MKNQQRKISEHKKPVSVKKHLKICFLIIIIIVLSFFSCTTNGNKITGRPPSQTKPAASLSAVNLYGDEVPWVFLDEGLYFLQYTDKEKPLSFSVICVELFRTDTWGQKEALWEIVFTKPAGDRAGRNFLMEGMTVSQFAEITGSRAAVNGGPFTPYRYFSPGQGQNPAGLFLSYGELLSPPAGQFAALVIKSDNQADIIRQNEVFENQPIFALGGFQKLLASGSMVPEILGLDESKAARTLLGLSEEKNRLYLVAVDGKIAGHSTGLTLTEAAELLSSLGVSEGMNMDGGGSTTMVLRNEEGKLKTVNRSSNLRGFGERIVATHIGIKKVSEE